ncbi:MAG: glycosyltransferase [Synechococcales cyanobacterium M58_A2018_015]|nr:glycosyltransferase [Synechococcales cyanobacterium M58_A2018_015]
MISVITPVYNGERFIEGCIQAVIKQNCPDVEHIIVDGCSSDRTMEIVKGYAAHHPHIRWLSEPDQGQSDAMNKGIALAKGDILSFLNVDDYYEPNVLNRVTEIFKTLPQPSLLVGNCNVWDRDDHIRFVNKPKHLKLEDLLLGDDVNPMPYNPSAYFYHTSLHQLVGLYDLNEHYCMDLDFLLRAVQVAHLRYVNEVWGNFRRIEGTKTFSIGEQGLLASHSERVLNKYQQQLPWFQRTLISWKRQFFKAIQWNRIKYFREHPERLIPLLKTQ